MPNNLKTIKPLLFSLLMLVGFLSASHYALADVPLDDHFDNGVLGTNTSASTQVFMSEHNYSKY